MSRHDDTVRLRHMLDYCREARDLADGRIRADLDSDRMFDLSMTRLMEVIGEAAGRVGEETRSQHTEIPWPQIVALRNRLIHGYDNVDFDMLWKIVQLDLPPLIAQLEQILGESPGR